MSRFEIWVQIGDLIRLLKDRRILGMGAQHLSRVRRAHKMHRGQSNMPIMTGMAACSKGWHTRHLAMVLRKKPIHRACLDVLKRLPTQQGRLLEREEVLAVALLTLQTVRRL